MSLDDTPRANRLHIGIYGKRNVGKSSLINAVTGQPVALVSDVAGTTTDPVYKSMEIHGIGPVVLIDTAGLDDTGQLGQARVEKTREAVLSTDIAIVVFTSVPDVEAEWLAEFRRRRIPVVAVVNKADAIDDPEPIRSALRRQFDLRPLLASATSGENIDEIRGALVECLPENHTTATITGGLVSAGDLVLLVMPQDIQAPRGRLILPQVQTLRELLDTRCLVMSCTTDQLGPTLAALVRPPKLIITDSQVFGEVYQLKPAESALTSFSVLYAGYKGDIAAFVDGARAIAELTEDSHVLVAEACTHVPLDGDIGRIKIPTLLRNRVGSGLRVTVVSGREYPKDLTPYDLVIHCGACMFNRRHVLSRVERAQRQSVPICNYGIVLAHLAGILDKITLPGADRTA